MENRLGENGLYLHGLPYVLAPAEQTEVPVSVWLGDSSDIDVSGALVLKEVSNSRDAVLRSLLTLFVVESDGTDKVTALCKLDEDSGDTEVNLTGATYSGQLIQGTDPIVTADCETTGCHP